MRPLLSTLACTLLALAPWSAHAADAVTEAMQAAYAPYRAALFRTNGQSRPESEQAMVSARAAWSGVMQRYGTSPTPPYDRDPQFAATLAGVDAVYAKAQALVTGGQLTQAHEVLEQARDLLADLRARNGVVTFSDHINAYHAQMEAVLGDGKTLLDQPGGTLALLERAAVLDWLAGRLQAAAGPALRQDAEFTTMAQAVSASSNRLLAALRRQDAAAARQALEGLKAPYSRMFLRFG